MLRAIKATRQNLDYIKTHVIPERQLAMFLETFESNLDNNQEWTYVVETDRERGERKWTTVSWMTESMFNGRFEFVTAPSPWITTDITSK